MQIQGAEVPRLGRPRNPNVRRDRRGKSRGEPEHVIKAQSLHYRGRDLENDGISAKHADDALAGFSLGRLLLRGRSNPGRNDSIDQTQYDAGSRWAEIVRRHASIMGYSLGSPKAPSFVMVSSGVSCSQEPDQAEINAVRGRYRDCFNILAEAARSHGISVQLVTWKVCVENRPISELSESDYGALRIGLNVLARALR